MRFIQENSSLRVPHVFAYDTDVNNAANAAFMLIEILPGIVAMDALGGHQVHGGVIPMEYRKTFYQSVAECHVQMTSLRLPKIGTIVQFQASALDRETITQMMQRGPLSAEDMVKIIDVFPSQIKSMARRLPLHNKGPFPLCHDDFLHSNIMVDEGSFKVTGVIDWEGACTVPWGLIAYPEFIQVMPRSFDLPEHYDQDGQPLKESVKEKWRERRDYVEMVKTAEGEDSLLSTALGSNLNQALAYSRESIAVDSTPAELTPSPLDHMSQSRDPIEEVVARTLNSNLLHDHPSTVNGQSLLRSLLSEPLRSVSRTSKTTNHRSLLDELPNDTRAALPSRDGATHLIDAYFEHCEFFSPRNGQGELNQRRWLFWALYTMERNLCVIVGRPFAIPAEAIHTSLPELSESDTDRAAALHLIKHRILESEIYATLTQKPPANGACLDFFAWRESMRRRVIEWLNSAPAPTTPSTQLAPSDIFDAILHGHLVLLYYPSTSFPNPSENDVLILAQSASECISNYRRTFRDGQLRFFWRTTHNLFRSGVAMAYCVHLNSVHHYPDLNQADMAASINTCMSILWAMVERYPSGSVYRDAFENLSSSVLRSAGNAAADGLGDLQRQQVSAFSFEPSLLADMALPQTSLDALYWGFGDLQRP
ncbi:Positive regulator of purine utilization [Colletotrichum orbiculare MAFF 240422]|uniref:Positive regulator of purine utilization n=1 Tax=Colletotrichum orbiculare (strain 104-T / ATCC 96160 / CBS 514.97 / LARS 414 / MAFF 240422) TaxID=1213857 RepID=A0A484G200_COLOR|nr:Positive regulator of purine utilization [Colletotrichum orbiculare MAFF 240422]